MDQWVGNIEKPWKLTVSQLEEKYKTNASVGLTTEEAKKRLMETKWIPQAKVTKLTSILFGFQAVWLTIILCDAACIAWAV